MIKLNVLGHSINYNIDINGIKYIMIEDIEKREQFKNVFISFFNKEKETEYDLENNITHKIYDEGELLNPKDYSFYYVGDNYDLDQEIKMGTKSLFLNYVDLLLNDIEFTDEYSSFVVSLETLIESINSNLLEYNEYKLNSFFEFNKKVLIKYISLCLFKDDLSVNMFDLSYYDKIIMQLELIKYVTKHNSKKNIVLIDLKYYDKFINDKLFLDKNIDYLIVLNNSFDIENYDNIFFDNNLLNVDFLDENSIYMMLCDENKNYSIKEYKKVLYDKVKKFIK